MADGAVEGAAPLRVFVLEDVLFRVLKKKRWLEAGKLSEAFLLETGETGLSVCFDCQACEAPKIARLDSHGVASLSYGGVTGIDALTVIADEVDHAEIRGMPHKQDNPAEAERIASELASISTIAESVRRRERDTPPWLLPPECANP